MKYIKLLIITTGICFTLAAAGCASSSKKEIFRHTAEEFNPANGKLVKREAWEEIHKGRAAALLADPKATAVSSTHTNATHFGGGSGFTVGEVSSVVSTNGIKVTGDAAASIGRELIQGMKK